MTVVVGIKISDGIVVASDSASSLFDGSNQVVNVYNNANKIFNLVKRQPIGAMTAGAGSLGKLSIATIAKDFRQEVSATSQTWSVSEFSVNFFEFIKDHHYDPSHAPGTPTNPVLNMWVFGFSPGEHFPEIYQFSLGATHSPPVEAIPKNEGGISMGGEPELIQRIVLGFGTELPMALGNLGVDPAMIRQALETQRHSQPIIADAMPVQDAIELADFLVRSTIEFSRFKMGAPTVGGPIEIAAVTRHEDFKWIKRKHYFDDALNPARGD